MLFIRNHFSKLVLFFVIQLFVGANTGYGKSYKIADREKQEIKPSNTHFVYMGRMDLSNPDAPELYWPGTSIKIGFEGTSLSILMNDAEGKNYYDIILDGNIEHKKVIHCQKGLHTYPVFSNLVDGRHTVEIFRRTDPTSFTTVFRGITVDDGAKLYKPVQDYNLKIEFYGDSITSGHGVLDTTRNNNGDLSTWDNYYAYGAVTARHFNADYRCISRSGIGVIKSWFPLIMPEMYDRLDPNNPWSSWDFSQWTPDVVAINLFQNDAWLLPKLKESPKPEAIINHYIDFVRSIRTEYPNVPIICMLGNMDITKQGSPWPGYVDKAVNRIREKYGDQNVYQLTVPFKQTSGHPLIGEQKEMADYLIRKIDEVFGSRRTK